MFVPQKSRWSDAGRTYRYSRAWLLAEIVGATTTRGLFPSGAALVVDLSAVCAFGSGPGALKATGSCEYPVLSAFFLGPRPSCQVASSPARWEPECPASGLVFWEFGCLRDVGVKVSRVFGSCGSRA